MQLIVLLLDTYAGLASPDGWLRDQVPSPAHREALEVCALNRITTESLLEQFMGKEDAAHRFAWLRDLSFIQSYLYGLFPHDLARDAILTDLRWRNPNHYAQLHRKARDDYMRQLETSNATEQQRILFEHIFLHRDNPIVRPSFNWQDAGVMAAPRPCG